MISLDERMKKIQECGLDVDKLIGVCVNLALDLNCADKQVETLKGHLLALGRHQ